MANSRPCGIGFGVSGLPAIHPGEFLREILDELGLTQAAFAKLLGVSAMRIAQLVRGERPVTAEMALRLGRAFGQSPQYWLNLQADYDIKATQPRPFTPEELARMTPSARKLCELVGKYPEPRRLTQQEIELRASKRELAALAFSKNTRSNNAT